MILIQNKVKYSLLIVLFLFPIYFLINHISNDFRLMNEYKYFNEITIINGKEINNFDYINKNLLFKESNNYSYAANNIFFNNKKELSFNDIPSKNIILSKNGTSSYSELLNKYGTFNKISFSSDLGLILSEYNLMNNSQLPNSKIKSSFSLYPLFTANSKEKLQEKFDFVKNNIFEQNMQIFDRYYIHENSFILSPGSEMLLGKDINNIFSQYGIGSIKLITFISKLYGEWSINNYEKAKKTIDILYYVSLFLFMLFFFKDLDTKLMFIILSGVALFGNTYYFFYYTPDSTNFKHLLDVSIILLLTRMNNKLILTLVSVLAFISIYINKEFGIFIFLSFWGTLFLKSLYYYIEDKKFKIFEIFILCFTCILFLVTLVNYPLANNPSVEYFFDGFYSFNLSKSTYIIIFSSIIVNWVALVFFYNKLKEKNYLNSYIFTIIYVELFMSYIVWHGVSKDLLFYSYLILLPYLILISTFNLNIHRYIKNFILLILIAVYVLLLNRFISDKSNHDNVFKSHKLYKWNSIRSGGLLSTYSFKPFEDSIKLIEKYNSGKEIYMISKYDNILSFLSDKYTALPFFELRSTIVTNKDYRLVKNILEKDSNILFVDTDIERDYKKELNRHDVFDIYADFILKDNQLVRIEKLKNLKKLFIDIKDNYKLVEKGKLISVYKRIDLNDRKVKNGQ